MIADWTGQEDAQQIEADVRDILNRFAPAEARRCFSQLLFIWRDYPAQPATPPRRSTDHARFVIYLDPFRATGRLHAAATILHELTHLERYRVRGFHANRAAAVLPKKDFVLLGLADEFAAYQAETNLVRSFLDSQGTEDVRRAARDAISNPELNWPIALNVMLGFEGPPDKARRIMEARRQVILDLERMPAIIGKPGTRTYRPASCGRRSMTGTNIRASGRAFRLNGGSGRKQKVGSAARIRSYNKAWMVVSATTANSGSRRALIMIAGPRRSRL